MKIFIIFLTEWILIELSLFLSRNTIINILILFSLQWLFMMYTLYFVFLVFLSLKDQVKFRSECFSYFFFYAIYSYMYLVSESIFIKNACIFNWFLDLPILSSKWRTCHVFWFFKINIDNCIVFICSQL